MQKELALTKEDIAIAIDKLNSIFAYAKSGNKEDLTISDYDMISEIYNNENDHVYTEYYITYKINNIINKLCIATDQELKANYNYVRLVGIMINKELSERNDIAMTATYDTTDKSDESMFLKELYDYVGKRETFIDDLNIAMYYYKYKEINRYKKYNNFKQMIRSILSTIITVMIPCTYTLALFYCFKYMSTLMVSYIVIEFKFVLIGLGLMIMKNIINKY